MDIMRVVSGVFLVLYAFHVPAGSGETGTQQCLLYVVICVRCVAFRLPCAACARVHHERVRACSYKFRVGRALSVSV